MGLTTVLPMHTTPPDHRARRPSLEKRPVSALSERREVLVVGQLIDGCCGCCGCCLPLSGPRDTCCSRDVPGPQHFRHGSAVTCPGMHGRGCIGRSKGRLGSSLRVGEEGYQVKPRKTRIRCHLGVKVRASATATPVATPTTRASCHFASHFALRTSHFPSCCSSISYSP